MLGKCGGGYKRYLRTTNAAAYIYVLKCYFWLYIRECLKGFMYNIPMYRYILYRKGVLVVVTSILYRSAPAVYFSD